MKRVDYASIGTNDLLQHFFATDRNNAIACHSYCPEHPFVWNVLREMIVAAKELGKPITICGEIAAELVIPGIARHP